MTLPNVAGKTYHQERRPTPDFSFGDNPRIRVQTDCIFPERTPRFCRRKHCRRVRSGDVDFIKINLSKTEIRSRFCQPLHETSPTAKTAESVKRKTTTGYRIISNIISIPPALHRHQLHRAPLPRQDKSIVKWTIVRQLSETRCNYSDPL